MKSLNTYKLTNGFTLVEVVIVLALLAVLLSMGLLVGMELYRSAVSHSQQSTLVAELLKARTDSLANIDNMSHGVGGIIFSQLSGTTTATTIEGVSINYEGGIDW